MDPDRRRFLASAAHLGAAGCGAASFIGLVGAAGAGAAPSANG